MKHLFAAVVVSLSAVTMQAQNVGHSKFSFIQKGTFAQVATSIPNGNVSLQVQSGTDPNNPGQTATFLFYTFFQFTPDGTGSTFTQVFGVIPNGTFAGVTTERLILDVDTSQLDPDSLTASTCTATFFPVVNVVCTDTAPAGLIHMEFKENGLQRGRLLNSESVTTLGSLTIHEHASGDQSSANMKGTFLGIPVADSLTVVGVNRNTFLEITKNP
jgi:hypothetical protein